MKVLLTGSTGMIGAALVPRLLAAGHDVRVLVRRPVAALAGVEVAQGDLLDPSALTAAMRGVEAVIHAAGAVSYWARRTPELERVNVGGTAALLAAAKATGVRRVVYTSSIAALGSVESGAPGPDGWPLGDEETPFNWSGLGMGYMETKHAADALVRRAEGVEGVVVNPGLTFGPGDVYKNAGRMFFQIARGTLPGVPPGGTTVATLQDVVEGHLLALERGRAGERYVLGGHPMSFLALYGEIAAVIGKPAPTRVLRPWMARLAARVSEVVGNLRDVEPVVTPQVVEAALRNRRYRSDKAVRELGYPVRPLRPCLQETWAWYQANV